MQKIPKEAITATFVVGAFFVGSLLNEGTSQLVYLIGVLLCGVLLLKNGLEMAGGPELIMGAITVFGPVCSKVLAESGGAGFLSKVINAVLQFVLGKLGVARVIEVGTESSVTLGFFIIFILVVALRGSRTVVEARKGSTDSEFKEKNYIEKSRGFCEFLAQRLRAIDRETDWNDSLFTPLEAEVEVCIRGKRKRKFSDLLKCLKSIRHRGSIFLVLGDPGAGKSVALRKLCMELLKESAHTKKIPVYVNLKKWNQDWNMNHLPSKDDLIAFIRTTLSEGGDFFTNDFLDAYFKIMLEDGRWYFVFDSFDEMPCLMGRQSCQELIGKISELLFDFLTGPGQNGGIIASRLYKSPSEALGATITLKIQKFTDIKIRKMLQKYLNNADGVIRELFGKREDLVVLCRNPFYLALLSNYLKSNDMRFPKNQMELYSNFVEHRLGKCDGKLEAEHLTKEEVRKGAKELAVFMQQSTIYGLECPLRGLIGYGQTKDWRKVLRLLEYVKICRFGGEDETASFVHRRFQEFFLVEHITENGQTIEREEYQSIISGSGMRDALVLYCEVTEEEQAREIAHFCWDTVRRNIRKSKSVWNDGSVELIGALHFMTEAFRNRRSAIEDFRDQLEQLVERYLNNSTDFVVQLALVDSMALFEQTQIQRLVLQVFRLGNHWLSDVVVENCRVIKQLSTDIESRFVDYIVDMDIRTFVDRFWNMQFSLSISKGFRYIRAVHCLLAVFEMVLLAATVGAAAILVILSIQLVPDSHITVQEIQMFWNKFLYSKAVVPSPAMFLMPVWMIVGMFFFTVNPNNDLRYKRKKAGNRTSHKLDPTVLELLTLLSLEFDRERDRKTYQRHLIVDYFFQILKLPGAYALWYYAAFPVVIVTMILLQSHSVWAWVSVEVIAAALMLTFLMVVLPILLHELHRIIKDKTWKKIIKVLKRLFTQRESLIAVACSICLSGLIEAIFILVGIRWSEIVIVLLCMAGVIFIIYLFIQATFRGIRYIKDKHWINKQPSIQHLSRKKLAENLKILSCIKSRQKYIDLLLQQKTELTGAWDNNKRPRYGNDRLDYSLTRLDCAKLDSCNYLF